MLPLNFNNEWMSAELRIDKNIVKCFRKIATGNIDLDDSFMQEHLPSALREGAVLIHHMHEPVLIPANSTTPSGLRGFTAVPTGADFWYIPHSSFQDSLKLLECFGFPGGAVFPNAMDVRNRTISLLKELEQGRRITLVTITSDTIRTQRIEGNEFTTEEMTRLLRFNEANFGIEYAKSEFLDLRRLYLRKGFFVLGRM